MTDLLHGDTSTTLPHASPKPDKTRRRFLMFGAGAAGAAAAAPVLAATPAALVETADGETPVAGVPGNRARAQLLRDDAHLIAMNPARRVLTLATPH